MAISPERPIAQDIRRKRARFRAWHRGTRELDLLLGAFADRFLPEFDDSELEAFEDLMKEADTDLYGWITGTAPVPDRICGSVFERLRQFHKNGRRS